jgi:uncharacterized membrane protein
MSSTLPPELPERGALYTPGQTFVATVIGGPPAAIWAISRNFRALSQYNRSKQTLWYGVGITLFVALLALKVANRLPAWFPPVLIPLGYSAAAMGFSQIVFAQHFNSGARRKSWPSVLGIGLLGILAMFAALALINLVWPNTHQAR